MDLVVGSIPGRLTMGTFFVFFSNQSNKSNTFDFYRASITLAKTLSGTKKYEVADMKHHMDKRQESCRNKKIV